MTAKSSIAILPEDDRSCDVLDDGAAIEAKNGQPDRAAAVPASHKSPPDGGPRAWTVVFACFLCFFTSFGWINAIGIFEKVYQTTILSAYDPGTVAWIVSLETFLIYIGGPFIGLLFDNYGARPIQIAGTFLHVFGLMMASISHEYWHFLLSQGICSSIGASLIFYSAVSSCVTWFDRHRGLALGFMASGSSIGGIVFPIMVQSLIPRVGFAWTLRAVAFLILGLQSIAILAVQSYIPPHPRRFDAMALIRPLGQASFSLLTVGTLVVFFAFFVPFTFLPLQALEAGLSEDIVTYIIPILNAASFFGRIAPLWASDVIGCFNMTLIMGVVCSILSLALWMPTEAAGPLLAFAILYGFASGAFISIQPALVAVVSPDLENIGARTGLVFAINSIGALVGQPVAGALISLDGGGYTKLKLFCGAFWVGGTAILILCRFILSNGRLWVKL